MMRKYRIDLFCVVLFFVSIPLLAVDRPEINYSNEIKIELSETGGHDKIAENISYDKLDYKNIETRNVFSPNGLYKSAEGKGTFKPTEGKGTLTEKSYRLIGVFISGQKRAVFMKERGGIIILNTGDMLGDDSVISSIENMSVRLKKDNKVIEHRIFKLENELDSRY